MFSCCLRAKTFRSPNSKKRDLVEVLITFIYHQQNDYKTHLTLCKLAAERSLDPLLAPCQHITSETSTIPSFPSQNRHFVFYVLSSYATNSGTRPRVPSLNLISTSLQKTIFVRHSHTRLPVD